MNTPQKNAGPNRTFHVVSLGCKVNQYECQALREAWSAAGFTEAPEPDGAGVIIIHTCAVTANAVADTRSMARRLHRAAPAAMIYLMGCAAECAPDELAGLPGVAGVVRRKDKTTFITRGPEHFSPEAICGCEFFYLPDERVISCQASPIGVQEGKRPEAGERLLSLTSHPALLAGIGGSLRRKTSFSACSPAGPSTSCGQNHLSLPSPIRVQEGRRSGGGEPQGGDLLGVPLLQRAGPAESSGPVFPPLAISNYNRARPVIKMQDGCSHGCSYCIVPLTRGRSVSRPPGDILAEMTRLHGAGFQELILSGINLRQYGRDFPRSAPIRDFWSLLVWLEARLAPDWTGRARWRLSSLEPGQLGEAALAALGESRLVAPHLHISLQSGSSSVLRRMGRGHYDPAALPEFLGALRRVWPVMGLGADILMGFPGESGAEFAETRAFVADLPLTYAHVFPFSPRPGTAAAVMPGQVPRGAAEERAAIIRAVAEDKKEAFLRFLLERPGGGALRMLLESRDTGLGVSEYYASCHLPAAAMPDNARAGAILDVRPAGLEPGRLAVVVK